MATKSGRVERKTKIRDAESSSRHPYLDLESDSLWPVIEHAIADLVKNGDVVEQARREYIVGYLVKAVRCMG
jgi:hypothetical protein